MIILKSETITRNLLILEDAKKSFPILIEFENCLKNTNGGITDEIRYKISNFRLDVYSDFILFIFNMEKSNQIPFYNDKISIKDFREALVNNAFDDDAKKVLGSKTKTTFSKLINSKIAWNKYSGISRRSYYNNLINSSPIIANFCIQNEIEIEDSFIGRINKFYLIPLPVVDLSILKEMELTKSIIDSTINKFNDIGIDFRKVNINELIGNIRSELVERMLDISEGECVKCIDTSYNYKNLTYNKNYYVISKHLDMGILRISIKDDFDNTSYFNYRLFETQINLRDSILDSLINDL